MATPSYGKAFEESQEEVARTQREPQAPPTAHLTTPEGVKEIPLGRWELQPYQPPGYTQQPAIGQEGPPQTPNYERLTATERWVMNRLPGIAQSGVGQALQWFGNTWAGRALAYLDVGAEALERTVGFAAQAIEASHSPEQWQDFTDNMREAWYAGSLAADVGESPTGQLVPYTVGGGGLGLAGGALIGSLGGPAGTLAGGLTGAAIGTAVGLGVRLMTDGGESMAGLVETRQRLEQLTRAGMDPGEALAQVRDQMYESEGALALRSQMNDMWFHMFADPLNVLAEWIKPVEALAVRRIVSLERALPDEVVSATADIERAIESTRETLRAAEQAQNAEQAAAEATRVADLERSLELLRQAPQMSPWQQTMLRIAGDLDWPEESAVGRFLNSRAGRIVTAPFRLTRESRAYAFVNTIEDNVRAYLPQDFQAAMRTVIRARDGVYSPQLAHMVTTTEGRYVRSMMSGIAGVGEDLLRAREVALPRRQLVEMIASVLGDDVYKVFARLDNEAPAVLRQFTERLGSVPDGQRILEEVLRAGGWTAEELTPDLLKGTHGILSGTNLLTDQTLRLEFLNRVADLAAQAGIAKFGVRARGTLLAAAEAIKAAESLALLRAGNVVYPLRNWMNNVVTMIARGTYAGGSREAAQEVERILGGVPTRMRAGFGFAGQVGSEGLSAAEDLIARAARGERGFWDRARTYISGIHFPGDTGAWARRIEVGASQRAYASGFNRFFTQARRSLLTNLEDAEPALAQAIRTRYGDDALRALRNATLGSGTDEDLLRAVTATDNANLNITNIMDAASQRFGTQLDNILDETFTAKWGPEIETAARAGRPQLEATMSRLWGEVQDELDTRLDDSLQTLIAETQARVQTEGPGSFPGVFGDAVDEFYGSYVQGHAQTMARVGDMTALRPEVAQRSFDILLDQEQRFMNRGWSRLEARMQAVSNALSGMNIRGGNDVMTAFREWRDGWSQFFDWRNTTWREFFDARGSGRPLRISFDEIRAQIGQHYDDVVGMEAERLGRIDRVTASMLPDNLRPTFAAWRDRVSALRANRAQMMREWFDQVDSIPYDQRDARYAAEFWPRVMENNRATAIEERLGSRAVAGNADAAAQYTTQLEASSAEAQALVDARLRQVTGAEDVVARRLGEVAAPEGETARYAAEQAAAQGGVVTEAQRANTLAAQEAVRARMAAATPVQREVWLVAGSRDSVAQGLTQKWITPERLRLTEQAHALNNVFVRRGGFIRWGFEELEGQRVPVLTYIERNYAGGGSEVLRDWMDELDTAGQRMFLTNELLADTVNAEGRVTHRGQTFFNRMVRDGVITRLRDAAPIGGEQRILFRIGGEAQQAAHIPDLHAFVPRQLYMDTGIDQLWYLRGQHAVESIRDAALDLQTRPPLRFGDLAQEEQQALTRWVSGNQVQLAQARYAGMRGAEFMRDSALLNYNRRHNYNTFLGVVMPYEFWFTESALKWAMHSIDRPEMLMFFLRMKKFMNTAYRPEQNLPERLRGQVRINLPFLPDWMGDSVFSDPMRFILPLDQFGYPWEQIQQQNQNDVGAAGRALQQLLNDGQIDQAAFNEAMQQQAGPAWERAIALARQDDDEERLSAFDFMSLFSSPHVPIMWAYNAIRGTPQRIGPLLPLTRSIRGVTSALGIGPPGGVNIEGNIRHELGLPEFDQWDDYRIDRMLSNMVATGEITLQQEREAMTSRAGEAFDEARRRAGQELSGGPGLLGVAKSLFGVPIRAYPEGEEHLRELRDQYAQAWTEYDAGDEGAIDRFFGNHPEYQARLDLGYWNKPEERIRHFAVDEIWDAWNAMPDLTQDEVSEQLGPLFQNAFLNRQTRSYESIPNEILVAWSRVMRGEPPGTLSVGPGWQVPPLDLAAPDIAYRAQNFYESRDAFFMDWRNLQDDYFNLNEGAARRTYLAAHPVLRQYFNWRRDWLMRNPDIVPYLVDNPEDYTYPSEQALQQAQQAQPNLTPAEWQIALGPNLVALIEDYADGEEMPSAARQRLQEVADGLGTTYEAVLSSVAQGLAMPQ